jgi:hypothetical protein
VANVKHISLKEAWKKLNPLRKRLKEKKYYPVCNFCNCHTPFNVKNSILLSPILNTPFLIRKIVKPSTPLRIEVEH